METVVTEDPEGRPGGPSRSRPSAAGGGPLTTGHRESDRRFLGLDVADDGRTGSFVIRPLLVNPNGRLFGGTAVAASVAMMESLGHGEVAWLTTQFIGSAGVGETVRLQTVVSAGGRRTAQVRVTGSADGREIFVTLGAVGAARPGPDPAQWLEMPKVAPPESCLPYAGLRPGNPARAALVERLHAVPVDPRDDQPNRVALWTRIRGQVSTTPAMLGWLADMVGLAIRKAAPGAYDGATSLDNTLRISGRTHGEWVLVDLHGESVRAGYGHGRALLWSADGQLLATASQTAVMRPARNSRS